MFSGQACHSRLRRVTYGGMEGGEHIRPRFRKLRIAFSAACGVLCLLLIVLWVRSFWYADDIARFQNGNMYLIESAWGSLRPVFSNKEAPVNQWYFSSERVTDNGNPFAHATFGWDAKDFPTYFMAYVPHWLVALLFATAAAAPWMHWSKRFSLRTLLIAVTVVAVLLGLVVVFW